MKLRHILHRPLAITAVGVLLSALALTLDSRVGGATPRG